MDTEQLIKHILEQVLLQLGSPVARPCVVVMAERADACETLVRRYVGDEAELVFLGDDCAGRTPCRHIVPMLSCSAMSDLAAGKADDMPGAAILRLLLEGTSVEVIEFEYKKFTTTAPAALYSLYESYQKTLESFGLKECKAPQPECIRCREMLITEKVVAAAHDNGVKTLLVAEKAVVTPLAADTAVLLGLGIEKRP